MILNKTELQKYIEERKKELQNRLDSYPAGSKSSIVNEIRSVIQSRREEIECLETFITDFI